MFWRRKRVHDTLRRWTRFRRSNSLDYLVDVACHTTQHTNVLVRPSPSILVRQDEIVQQPHSISNLAAVSIKKAD